MDLPAIVIAAFQRTASLQRLLRSLSAINFPDGSIPLVISVDHGGPMNVKRVADEFEWSFGPKEVLVQDKHIGQSGNYFLLGDLTKKYGSVIILDDDLSVAPSFYEFARKGLAFYATDPKVAALSVYAHDLAESTAVYPFFRMRDKEDVYFLQFPVAWGQVWSRKNWEKFRSAKELENWKGPDFFRRWPKESSSVQLLQHLIGSDQYLVCPSISLASHFGDAGSHFYLESSHFQVPILLQEVEFEFKRSGEGPAHYDAWFEIEPGKIKEVIPEWKDFDFEVDLYGFKDSAGVDRPMMLTTKLPKGLDAKANKLKPGIWHRWTAVSGKQLPAILVPTSAVRKPGRLRRLRHKIHMHRLFFSLPSIASMLAYSLLRKIGVFRESGPKMPF